MEKIILDALEIGLRAKIRQRENFRGADTIYNELTKDIEKLETYIQHQKYKPTAEIIETKKK